MKTYLTITVDIDVLVEAKAKIGNLSGTINEMLKTWVNLPKEDLPDDKDKLKNLLAIKSAEIEGFKKQLSKLDKKEEQSKKSIFI